MIGTVTPMATMGTMMAMKIVGAAAVTSRERRSRPSSSVPSRCASEGPCRTAVRSCSSGPYLSHRGEVSDARTSPTSQTSEMTAAGDRKIRPPRRRSVAARSHDGGGGDGHDARSFGSRVRLSSSRPRLTMTTTSVATRTSAWTNGRSADPDRRLHRLADARQCEQHLDDDRTAEQDDELDGDARDDRQAGPAQRMHVHDPGRRSADGPQRAHVLLSERLRHRSARLACDARRRCDRDRQHGQDERSRPRLRIHRERHEPGGGEQIASARRRRRPGAHRPRRRERRAGRPRVR